MTFCSLDRVLCQLSYRGSSVDMGRISYTKYKARQGKSFQPDIHVKVYGGLKIYCHYIHVGWCIKECPLYRGVIYSECPLSEVTLYIDT